MIKKVFEPYGNKLAITFFDDFLVYARSWEELLIKLEKILELLRDTGLTLNLKKCKFGLENVEYLGLIIGKEGISPSVKKVKAISEFSTPRNTHEARRFHGMASFFRRFIPGFSRIIAPIINSFKNEQNFIWGETEEKAFREIKDKLVSKPVLAHYNPRASRTELHTDASADGLGAMLFQASEQDDIRLVYAISKKTSVAERSYHSSKLEFLAIIWAVDRLRPLLIDIHFDVYTDCQALVYMLIH